MGVRIGDVFSEIEPAWMRPAEGKPHGICPDRGRSDFEVGVERYDFIALPYRPKRGLQGQTADFHFEEGGTKRVPVANKVDAQPRPVDRIEHIRKVEQRR